MSTPPVPTATPVHAAIARYRQAQQALHDARQAERDAHDLVTAAEDTSALAAGNTALGDARQAVLVATNDVRQADLARSAALATTNAILSQRIRLLAANSRLPGLFDEDLKRLVGFLHQPTFAHAANLAESIGFTAETMLALRGIWREHQGRAEGTARFESISKIVAGNTFWDVVRDMEDLDDHHFMLALEVWVVSHRRVASPGDHVNIPLTVCLTHRSPRLKFVSYAGTPSNMLKDLVSSSPSKYPPRCCWPE
ncbi:hypothetical protein C8F01DRAFT_1125660 [Mycena amicta]|nr:hypothetical protein C8F01DRAFT_1125660 [Mycena amicta]